MKKYMINLQKLKKKKIKILEFSHPGVIKDQEYNHVFINNIFKKWDIKYLYFLQNHTYKLTNMILIQIIRNGIQLIYINHQINVQM